VTEGIPNDIGIFEFVDPLDNFGDIPKRFEAANDF
tara:strand:- start:1 stop:105 length:105 start_codon:yes stop_codon:yes gene_type:complete